VDKLESFVKEYRQELERKKAELLSERGLSFDRTMEAENVHTINMKMKGQKHDREDSN
jgi:hypothetical protein